MLTYMRKNAGSWIIKVLFVAIIITFIFFYGYGSKQGPEDRVLATAGEQKITTAQYQTAYANMMRLYQQMYQNQITDQLARTLGLKQNLLDDLIEQALLLQEAERRNLLVSAEEIKKTVMQQPYMQENGVFSERRYAAVLSSMKMTAAQYEQQAAHEIMLQYLRSMITEAVYVSEQELKEVFQLRGEKIFIDYLEFSQSDISQEAEVSGEELQQWYDQHSENYRVNEMVQANYIVFDPQDYIGRIGVEQEQIRDLYDADQARFVEPEQVRARHILLKADRSTGPENVQAVRARAQGLLDTIKNGADFAALAKKHSQDEATAGAGGDLGFFGRGVMVAPFEKAAFAMQPGEVSEVVETQFGFHIIKLEEKKPERVQPLDEVREEIVRELQQELAEKEVRAASRRAFNRLFTSRDLEGYAEANGLALKKTGLFVFGKGPDDAQGDNAFSRQAFALQPDELAPVFSMNKKYYLIKLTDKKPSHIASLETVREKVEAEVQRNKRFERAREQAEKALAMLSENNFDWDTAAKTFGRKIRQAEIARSGDFVPGLGRNPELKRAAFKLEAGQTADQVFSTESSSVLVRAREKKLPPESAFESEKETLRQQLLRAKQQEALETYIKELKERYEVSVDQELFETL
jgi:peptidyl-prolyl cis-trans isomerase D